MGAASSVERLRQAFKGREQGVAAVCLFGSVARGESHVGSDLDVAVLLEPAPERGTFDHFDPWSGHRSGGMDSRNAERRSRLRAPGISATLALADRVRHLESPS